MLREFQAEIARLKTQLAERQQGRVASAGSRGGSPEKVSLVAAAGGSGGLTSASGNYDASGSGNYGSSSGSSMADARVAAIRQSMRAELQRQLRQAVTVEALAKARKAIEQQARYGR